MLHNFKDKQVKLNKTRVTVVLCEIITNLFAKETFTYL